MKIKTAYWDIAAPWRVYIAGRLVATVILRDHEVTGFRGRLGDSTAVLWLEAHETGTGW